MVRSSKLEREARAAVLESQQAKKLIDGLNKLIANKKQKAFKDIALLRALVYAIEVCGFNKDRVFKKYATDVDGVTYARVKAGVL